jgi:hypothetical protein
MSLGVERMIFLFINTGRGCDYFMRGQDEYQALADVYDSSAINKVQRVEGNPYVIFITQNTLDYVLVFSDLQYEDLTTQSLIAYLDWF